jgi:hypothetical protein
VWRSPRFCVCSAAQRANLLLRGWGRAQSGRLFPRCVSSLWLSSYPCWAELPCLRNSHLVLPPAVLYSVAGELRVALGRLLRYARGRVFYWRFRRAPWRLVYAWRTMCRLSSIVSPCTTKTSRARPSWPAPSPRPCSRHQCNKRSKLSQRKLTREGVVHRGACARAHETEIERKGEQCWQWRRDRSVPTC